MDRFELTVTLEDVTPFLEFMLTEHAESPRAKLTEKMILNVETLEKRNIDSFLSLLTTVEYTQSV